MKVARCAYLFVVLLPTFIYTILLILVVVREDWDRSSYTLLTLSTGPFTVAANGSVLLDSRGTCQGTATEQNGSFLVDEISGIWRLFRQFKDEQEEMETSKVCGANRTHSVFYLNQTDQLDAFCCGGCCAYDSIWRREFHNSGKTTQASLYTAISSVFVSIILLGVTAFLVLIFCYNKRVTVARMTGITLFSSGLFLMFSLVTNHFKISIMNKGRSMPYLANEIKKLRTTEAGSCMYLGWAAVFASFIASTLWIQFSRYLVKIALEGPITFYHSNANDTQNNEATTALTALSRPVSALAARMKMASRRRIASSASDNLVMTKQAVASNGTVNDQRPT